MPVDIEKIRDAFKKFQDDDYVDAKKTIQQEIRGARNEYLENKLGLEKPIGEACKKKGKVVIVKEDVVEDKN